MVQVQIVIATQEGKNETYALLIYNNTNLSEEDKEQIGFTAGFYTTIIIVELKATYTIYFTLPRWREILFIVQHYRRQQHWRSWSLCLSDR